MDKLGLEVKVRESVDHFKFGASRVHRSDFSVDAWFATRGCWYVVNVAVVPCRVPLLFSRPVLSKLGATYAMGRHEMDLTELGVYKLDMEIGHTGHPVLPVADFSTPGPPQCDHCSLMSGYRRCEHT